MRAASDGGDVVRLTGVSDGFVVGKGDAFAGNPIKICYYNQNVSDLIMDWGTYDQRPPCRNRCSPTRYSRIDRKSFP
jgi:hypothetical protein